MREIKFRAWDKKKKRWIAGFNMCNYHEYFNKGLKPSISRYYMDWKDGEYELMQYTGRHDKNGKELYEDDICTVFLKEDLQETMVVRWDVEGAGFRFYDNNGGFWRVSHTPIEIIGNDFENPELREEH